MNYNTIIVGAGIAGATAARILAEEGNQKVLVIERRNHIGGNCYDELDDYGILIHTYGPHIFHTGEESVREFLSRFTDWYDFGHEVVAKVADQLIPVPFNLNTLHMVYEKEKADRLEQKLIAEYGEGSRVPIMKLRENEDPDVREIAEYVYQNVFLRYTMKQWGQKPEEISPEVTGRVPVVISYDNRYFKDKYQSVPIDGFTPMFEKMLDHPNIEVRLNTDCLDVLSFEDRKIYFEGEEFTGNVIYTGAIDELFHLRFGRLPYRSLDFKFEHLDQDSFQGHSVVNYTVSEDFTRITEFKFLTGQKNTNGTTIVREYPFAYTGAKNEIPYYAILNEDNEKLYGKYKTMTEEFGNFHLLGRLAEYKYYNIDAMTLKAMELARTLL
ncbi:UDP-galactopyranose mutase [Agathobacter ruminis]|uniref:UDP-galactopyranose mutase n=1 Tax=Agathobacter ruminis TaxID=1712665 RepID=A0A2G3E1S9_9FIRM|nr:UDP-galactopyranose mutase [Agathobacter ruminis]MDC7300603.1 UDP-galactopyranose mutase [Agathobacter ruminis]PHU37236.1 UDP-galactopyranose mutase [Agathobacter ruminis]